MHNCTVFAQRTWVFAMNYSLTTGRTNEKVGAVNQNEGNFFNPSQSTLFCDESRSDAMFVYVLLNQLRPEEITTQNK